MKKTTEIAKPAEPEFTDNDGTVSYGAEAIATGLLDGIQVRTDPTDPPMTAPLTVNRVHGRTAPRARGAGRPPVRSTSKRSSASGDSGDSDGSSEPPRRRHCKLCGGERPPEKRKYCSDQHAGRDRLRQWRERDRERDVTPKVPRDELDRLLSKAVCRCNGHHVLDVDPDLGERCVLCGRQRPESTSGRKLLRQLAAVRRAVTE